MVIILLSKYTKVSLSEVAILYWHYGVRKNQRNDGVPSPIFIHGLAEITTPRLTTLAQSRVEPYAAGVEILKNRHIKVRAKASISCGSKKLHIGMPVL